MIPDNEIERRLTFWTVACEGRQIVCRLQVAAGPVQSAEIALPGLRDEIAQRAVKIRGWEN